MTDKEILKLWRPYGGQGADALLSFSRLLIQAERAACIEACDAVDAGPFVGAHEEYLAGKEMAVKQCLRAILARNDLPTGE